MEGAQGFLSQARQKGHVQFLCFMFCTKRVKKSFTRKRRLERLGESSRAAIAALPSCVVTRVFIGSISPISSPLERGCQPPAAIAAIPQCGGNTAQHSQLCVTVHRWLRSLPAAPLPWLHTMVPNGESRKEPSLFQMFLRCLASVLHWAAVDATGRKGGASAK